VHYWLKEPPPGALSLSFLDADGREIRTFTSRASVPSTDRSSTASAEAAAGGGEEPLSSASSAATGDRADEEPRPTTEAGANRFVWDLRGPDAPKLPDNKGRGGTAEMLAGPRMPPGPYEVRLKVGGRTLTQRFDIEKDPRAGATDADLREQFAWAKRAHDLLTRVHDAVLTLRDVRTQAEAWAERVDAPALKAAARALAQTLTASEEALIQVRAEDPRMFPSKLNSRLAAVVGLIEYSDAAPTAALRELTESLALRIAMELAKLDRCLAEDVPAFNALCREVGLAAIVPKPRAGGTPPSRSASP
jgi:hypothetical protein